MIGRGCEMPECSAPADSTVVRGFAQFVLCAAHADEVFDALTEGLW